jgi:hypothetical protein
MSPINKAVRARAGLLCYSECSNYKSALVLHAWAAYIISTQGPGGGAQWWSIAEMSFDLESCKGARLDALSSLLLAFMLSFFRTLERVHFLFALSTPKLSQNCLCSN